MRWEDAKKELTGISDEEKRCIESVAKKRLKAKDVAIYSDEEVRGDLANSPVVIDENDGWE